MSYTPPSGDAVTATWLGATAYVAPKGYAVTAIKLFRLKCKVHEGVQALHLNKHDSLDGLKFRVE